MKSKLLKGLTSACSIGLAAVIVSLAVTRGTLEAEAAETLLGIRTLINDVKEQEREYVILEIVPDRNTAGIGIYFSGYEPVLSSWDEDNEQWKSWQEGLFDCIPTGSQTLEEVRREYVEELNVKLEAYLADFGTNHPVTYSEYRESDGPEEGFTRLEAPATIRYGYFEEASSGVRYALRFMYSAKCDDGFSPLPGVAYYKATDSEIAVTIETDDDTGEVIGVQIVTKDGAAVADASPLYSFTDGLLTYQCTAGELKERILGMDLDLILESTDEETEEEESSTVEESTEESSTEESSDEESLEESSSEEETTETDSSEEESSQPDSSEEGDSQPDTTEEESKGDETGESGENSGKDAQTVPTEEPSTADFSASSKDSRIRTVTVTLPQLLSSPAAGSVSANDASEEEKKDEDKMIPDQEDASEDKDVSEEEGDFAFFDTKDISADIGTFYVVDFTYISDIEDTFKHSGTMLYVVDNREPIQEQAEGTYAFVEDENGGEYRFGAAPIYYQGGFENQEWFRKHVLNLEEEEYDSFPVRVITMTPEEINNAEAIPAYDFLYINDGLRTSRQPENGSSIEEYTNANDLSNPRAEALFNDVVTNEKPCVVEGGILFEQQGDSVEIRADLQNTQLFRLCAMLCQESPSSYASNFNGLGLDAMIDGILEDQDRNFVTEQTYCVFRGTSIFNGDFYTPTIYQGGAEEIQQGFQDVLNEIEIENLYREADISSQGGLLPTDISQATVIRHIMNYRNKRSGITKDSIRVLEIQPAKTTEAQGLTKKTLMEWAPGLQEDKITITRMTTAEFIGKVETLNDKYDLIYIGTSKEHMNVVKGTDQGEGSTVYNDHAMDGLIYTHTGDMRYAGMELSGQLDTDYLDNNRNNNVYYYTPVRYGGNDITQEKLNALNSYLDGSYPVIVSDEFFESPVTVYQDINYGGYSVNLGVGDYTRTQMEQLGIRDNDITSFKVKDGYKVTFYRDDNFQGGILEATGDSGWIGNDWNDQITSIKVELLEDAHPLRAIDEDHIDNCSYMYDFAKGALDANRSNFYAESDIEDNSRLFQFYLNRPKINLTGTSANGSLQDGIYYIGKGMNGRYTLEYHFTIINEGTASTDTQYQCRFYVDVNADGKFSSLEELGDILITNNGNVVSQNQLYAGREYVMTRNVPDGYKGVLPWKVEISQVNNANIYCSLDGYTKLEGLDKETIKILQISRDRVIEQWWWGGNGETLFSLAEQINGKKTLYDSGDGYTLGHSSDEVLEGYENSLYHALIYGGYYGGVFYEGISDAFEIDADFMTISMFEQEFNAGRINMDDYNMLILGFSDAYGDFSGDANSGPMGAIIAFINSGKSVLFAHDNTSYFNYEKGKRGITNRNEPWNTSLTDQYHNASTLNKYIRDLVGMDRYGVMNLAYGNVLKTGQSLTSGTENWNIMASMGKEIPYEAKSGKTRTVPQTQGYTYSIINAKDKHADWPNQNITVPDYSPQETGLNQVWTNQYLNIRYDTVYYHDTDGSNPTGGVGYPDNGEIPLNFNGEVTNLWVTQANRGQITDYPYKLAETFPVSTTHAQYYQLDFTADSDGDGQSDLVVWYCLGDRTNGAGQHQETIYSQSPNDVSNNYYIYNKGNITYTGVGHSGMDSAYAVDEAKLFVNTMIAAYNAGLKNPLITVLETGSRNASSVDVAYRYQDEGTGLVYEKYDGDYEKVYFTVEDVNFVNGSRRLAVKAYYETEDGDVIVNDQDGTMRLREFTASALFYTASGDQQVDPGNLESGGVYYILVPKSLIRDNEKNDSFQIYLEAQSFITSYGSTRETGKAYAGLEFRKAYLFDIT